MAGSGRGTSKHVCAQLLLLAAALCCVQVQGHGYMSFPPSRNCLGRNSNPVITYTPHGGNGRGEKACCSLLGMSNCSAAGKPSSSAPPQVPLYSPGRVPSSLQLWGIRLCSATVPSQGRSLTASAVLGLH